MNNKLNILIIFFVLGLFIIYNIYYNYFVQLDKPFYTISEVYSNLKIFNYNFNNILLEVNNIINDYNWIDWPEYNLISREIYNNNNNKKWTIFPFKIFGKWHDKNIKLCPNIYSLLKNVPELFNASLSRLSAETSLEPHQGWAILANYNLRCHLGIIIPGNSYIYCDNEKRKQEINKWIIFDDSKLHWADNNSKNDRIVLILDIKRPTFIKKGISNINDTTELIDFINIYNNINIYKFTLLSI
jgi:aspartyl/asparaginyl beta-hydroxylase (cupin superfamily)